MALFPHMTVHENIAFPLKMRRFDSNIIDGRVEEMLDLVELPGYQDRKPNELSGVSVSESPSREHSPSNRSYFSTSRSVRWTRSSETRCAKSCCESTRRPTSQRYT